MRVSIVEKHKLPVAVLSEALYRSGLEFREGGAGAGLSGVVMGVGARVCLSRGCRFAQGSPPSSARGSKISSSLMLDDHRSKIEFRDERVVIWQEGEGVKRSPARRA